MLHFLSGAFRGESELAPVWCSLAQLRLVSGVLCERLYGFSTCYGDLIWLICIYVLIYCYHDMNGLCVSEACSMGVVWPGPIFTVLDA